MSEPVNLVLVGFSASLAAGLGTGVGDEVLPETHRGRNPQLASFALLIGILVMLSLDVVLA